MAGTPLQWFIPQITACRCWIEVGRQSEGAFSRVCLMGGYGSGICKGISCLRDPIAVSIWKSPEGYGCSWWLMPRHSQKAIVCGGTLEAGLIPYWSQLCGQYCHPQRSGGKSTLCLTPHGWSNGWQKSQDSSKCPLALLEIVLEDGFFWFSPQNNGLRHPTSKKFSNTSGSLHDDMLAVFGHDRPSRLIRTKFKSQDSKKGC